MSYPVLAHLFFLMRADPQRRERLGSTKQYEPGFTVFLEIRVCGRLIEITLSNEPARAGQAAPLMADGRQLEAIALRSRP
jgi:hypothetical protein